MCVIFVTVSVPNRLIYVNIPVHVGIHMALVLDEVALGKDFFRYLDSSPRPRLFSRVHVSVK
jgi:hypothetical protein